LDAAAFPATLNERGKRPSRIVRIVAGAKARWAKAKAGTSYRPENGGFAGTLPFLRQTGQIAGNPQNPLCL
jgi:hypothetical protein